MEDLDLLVTHTPPYGVMDMSYSFSRDLNLCGCKALLKAVDKFKPKHHVFGHIHNGKDLINFGSRQFDYTKFYNASAIKDGSRILNSVLTNASGITINL